MSCDCKSFESREKNKKFQCPVCKEIGEGVPVETVENLCKDDIEIEDDYYIICESPSCEVVYYNEKTKITQSQVKVPIWYKDNANPKILCYCSNVTQEDLDKAVAQNKGATFQDIIEITGAMKNANCKMNNPTGCCCAKVIGEYTLKALQKNDY